MLDELLACPRCDKTPLTADDSALRCGACRIEFPLVNGIPWLFAEPQAALGEWRSRWHFALQQLGQDASRLDHELKNEALRPLTRRRLERYRKALESHRRSLQKLLKPIDVQSLQASRDTYLALRTRLPSDQGLNTYYANVHRDWSWGDEENDASLEQVRRVAGDSAELGRVLVLGAGACRLAYDLHMQMDCTATVAMDFNPLLLFIAQAVTGGDKLKLYEFPIAPRSLEDDAVLRTLEAPARVSDGLHFVLGDALRPPFAAGAFDTVVTPWLIDIVAEDLGGFARRINRLLKSDGRWINFGSLAFSHPERSRLYSPEETRAIIAEAGFSDPYVSEARIPYMCSPASRHGRREWVFTFSACKERDADRPDRYQALPDWIVTGKEPVPLTPSFRSQAMTTQIYSFMMSLIDGRRSIKDMAVIFEKQKLMSREEAEPAIRSFLTRMYDDARKPSGY